MLYSYLNLESTKTERDGDFKLKVLYSYLNLESTKTIDIALLIKSRCTVT